MPRIPKVNEKMLVYIQKTVIGVLISVLSFFLVNFYNDINAMKRTLNRMERDLTAVKVVLYVQTGIDLDKAKKLSEPKGE